VTDPHAYDAVAADLRILAARLELVGDTLPEPLYPEQPHTMMVGLPQRLDVLHVSNVLGTPFEDRQPWQVATTMRVGTVKVEWYWHDAAMSDAAEQAS